MLETIETIKKAVDVVSKGNDIRMSLKEDRNKNVEIIRPVYEKFLDVFNNFSEIEYWPGEAVPESVRIDSGGGCAETRITILNYVLEDRKKIKSKFKSCCGDLDVEISDLEFAINGLTKFKDQFANAKTQYEEFLKEQTYPLTCSNRTAIELYALSDFRKAMTEFSCFLYNVEVGAGPMIDADKSICIYYDNEFKTIIRGHLS